MIYIIKSVALAGILLLGACGASGNANVNEALVAGGNFSSRTFVVPQNFTTRLTDNRHTGVRIINGKTIDTTVAYREEFDIIGLDYLESISFDIPKDVDFKTYYLNGDGVSGRLGVGLSANDGIFMITSFDEEAIDSHIFVGILNTTDVGELLDASATFSGSYHLFFIVAPGRINRSYSSAGSTASSIILTADFTEGTLTGSDTEFAGDLSGRDSLLTVDGRFGDGNNSLSGSVTYENPSVSDNTFTAPLSGMIGQDGAVGVFSSHENTGDGSGYAFGGGFVVENTER